MEKLDLSKMASEDQEVLRQGARSILATYKAKAEGTAEDPVIPAELQAWADEKGVTIEVKKPAVMTAVDPAETVSDPADLELDGIGPQAKLKAPAIIHKETQREMKDFSLAHAIGILTLGGNYPYLADAGLEIEVLKEQKARSRAPMSETAQKALIERQAQLKDLNLGSEVAGSFLIPTEVNTEMIEKLRGQEIWM